jgi:hypothetical protein
VYYLNGGTVELIKQALAEYFTSDDISRATYLILTKCGEEVICVKKSRRIRDEDSRNKSDHDVIDIINELLRTVSLCSLGGYVGNMYCGSFGYADDIIF